MKKKGNCPTSPTAQHDHGDYTLYRQGHEPEDETSPGGESSWAALEGYSQTRRPTRNLDLSSEPNGLLPAAVSG